MPILNTPLQVGFAGLTRFAGGSPKASAITLYPPPSYDPEIMSAGDQTLKAKGKTRRLFEAYQRQIPFMVQAAGYLKDELMKFQSLPRLCLYPLPTPYAQNDLTIELQRPKTKPDAAVTTMRLEKERHKLIRQLRQIQNPHPILVSQDQDLIVLNYQNFPIRLHVIIAPTKEQARAFETYS